MKKYSEVPLFRKVLVPVLYNCDHYSSLAAARAITGDGYITLVGIVTIPGDESLSTAAWPAQEVRKTLHRLSNGERIRIQERVRVSYQPWEELVLVIQELEPDLLVLEWPCQIESLKIGPSEGLIHIPCDVAVVRGPIPDHPEHVLVSVRGGPYAELALRISLSIAHNCQAEVASLHLVSPQVAASQDAPFRGIDRILSSLPEVKREDVQTNEPVEAILNASKECDLVVMGATALPEHAHKWIGPITEQVLRECPAGVIVAKTSRSMPADLQSEAAGQTAISILVDKWFAENSYHANEFKNLDHLLALKRRQGVSISLALPALNEEATVGKVIHTIKSALMEDISLLDEIVLVDSDSTDRTRQIAAESGVPVFIHQRILPELGPRRGKGEALWKSLYVTHGDILIWIDTDIVNIHPGFVFGLLGPLLLEPDIQFVKGFYRRPLRVGNKIQAGGGGRVTELTARPLINLFYPELSGIIQPLSGEYGGRRAALEQLPFFSGYGVEIGLLIDVFEKFGLSAIAQVDLQERIHHNQPLESLSKMSFAIIQAVIRKLEHRYGRNILEEVNRTMKLIRFEEGRFTLEVEEIAEQERPPMVYLPEYWRREQSDPINTGPSR